GRWEPPFLPAFRGGRPRRATRRAPPGRRGDTSARRASPRGRRGTARRRERRRGKRTRCGWDRGPCRAPGAAQTLSPWRSPLVKARVRLDGGFVAVVFPSFSSMVTL